MIVVADSSPLVILAKLGCFDLLCKIFSRLIISPEVEHEVVFAGTGLPGAAEVAKAEWIEVKQLLNPMDLVAAQQKICSWSWRTQHDSPWEGTPCERGIA